MHRDAMHTGLPSPTTAILWCGMHPVQAAPHFGEKRVIKKGWAIKQGGASGSFFSRESWKKRLMVLEEKRLLWFEYENSLPKGPPAEAPRCHVLRAARLRAVLCTCAGEVYLTGAEIDSNPKETKLHKFAFAVRHPERTLFAKVDTEDEWHDWIEALNRTTEALGIDPLRRSVRRRSDAAALYLSDTKAVPLVDVHAAEVTPSLQLGTLPEWLSAILTVVDVDASGSIEWEEFLAFALSSGLDYGRIKKLWHQLLNNETSDAAAEFQGMKGQAQVILCSSLP